MRVKVSRIESFAVDVPYRTPLVIAGGSNLVAQHVLVKIYGDDGSVGLGEAAPMPSYGAETQGSVLGAISTYLAPCLIGLDPLDLETAFILMDRALPGNHFAKAALDIALHDLAAKSLGVPVCSLLGGRVREEIPIAWVVGISEVEETVRQAVEGVSNGFETVKLKIGLDPKADLERVAETRKAVGSHIALRVDANQGYDLATAIRVLRRMESYDLELIEQPLPRWDMDGMAKVAMALDTPVMADESIFDSVDALRVVREGAADIINIKIVKVGGLHNARKIVAIAEAAGIPCLIGSMIEFGIGTAAGLHFAAAMRNLRYSSELVGPLLLDHDIVQGAPFSLEKTPGSMNVPDGPGLGVEPESRCFEGGAQT